MLRALDHARLDRIEHDVANDLGQVRLPVDQEAVEAIAEQMTGSIVFLVEPLAVRPEEPLHAGGKGGCGRFHDQMEVIRHEYPGGEEPAVATDGFGEILEELFTITVGEEDVLPLVASGSDVMGSAGEVESKRSCHVAEATSAPRGSSAGRSS